MFRPSGKSNPEKAVGMAGIAQGISETPSMEVYLSTREEIKRESTCQPRGLALEMPTGCGRLSLKVSGSRQDPIKQK
jgi:hypothetical protein